MSHLSIWHTCLLRTFIHPRLCWMSPLSHRYVSAAVSARAPPSKATHLPQGPTPIHHQSSKHTEETLCWRLSDSVCSRCFSHTSQRDSRSCSHLHPLLLRRSLCLSAHASYIFYSDKWAYSWLPLVIKVECGDQSDPFDCLTWMHICTNKHTHMPDACLHW